MLKNATLLISILLFSLQARSQVTYQKFYTFTGTVYTEAVQTSDSGYVFSGLYGSGISTPSLIKINSLGDTLWTRHYTTSATSFGVEDALMQTLDGGFILTSAAIIKTDPNGIPLWAVSNGAIFEGTDAVESPNGDICAVGFSMDPGGAQITMIKLDAAGNMIFCKEMGGAGHDRPYGLRRAVTGGYILAGFTEVGVVDADPLLVRLDDSGNVLWAKSYGYPGGDGFWTVESLPDGSFLAMGYNTIAAGSNAATILVKLDSNGNVLWSKLYKENVTYGYGLYVTPNDEILMAGYTQLGATAAVAMIINADSSGNVNWFKKYDPIPGTFMDIFNSIDPTLDGGYLLTGQTSDNNGAYFYITKTDGNLDNFNMCSESTAPLTAQNITLSAVNYPITPVADFVVNETFGYNTLNIQTTTICSSVGMGENNAEEAIQIYPNPVADQLFVRNTTNEKLDMIIYDITGREQLRQELPFSSEVNVSMLPPGMYLVSLIGESVNYVQKVVRE